MIDIEKLAQELAFLSDRIREISCLIARNQLIEATFVLGQLHVICHNHSVEVSRLIAPKPILSQDPKDE